LKIPFRIRVSALACLPILASGQASAQCSAPTCPPGRAGALVETAAINIVLDRVGAHELLSVENGHQVTDREVRTSKLLILLMALGGFVVAGVLGAWFAETITRPVVRLRDMADRVSKGDLNDTEIDIERNDEIGELAAAFRRMVASLRFTLRRRGGGTTEAEPVAS